MLRPMQPTRTRMEARRSRSPPPACSSLSRWGSYSLHFLASFAHSVHILLGSMRSGQSRPASAASAPSAAAWEALECALGHANRKAAAGAAGSWLLATSRYSWGSALRHPTHPVLCTAGPQDNHARFLSDSRCTTMRAMLTNAPEVILYFQMVALAQPLRTTRTIPGEGGRSVWREAPRRHGRYGAVCRFPRLPRSRAGS